MPRPRGSGVGVRRRDKEHPGPVPRPPGGGGGQTEGLESGVVSLSRNECLGTPKLEYSVRNMFFMIVVLVKHPKGWRGGG